MEGVKRVITVSKDRTCSAANVSVHLLRAIFDNNNTNNNNNDDNDDDNKIHFVGVACDLMYFAYSA